MIARLDIIIHEESDIKNQLDFLISNSYKYAAFNIDVSDEKDYHLIKLKLKTFNKIISNSCVSNKFPFETLASIRSDQKSYQKIIPIYLDQYPSSHIINGISIIEFGNKPYFNDSILKAISKCNRGKISWIYEKVLLRNSAVLRNIKMGEPFELTKKTLEQIFRSETFKKSIESKL